jgi:cytochrome c556
MVVSLLGGGSALLAATAKTPVDLQKDMQHAGMAQQALTKAIRSTDYAGAQKQTKEMKEALVDAHGFWVSKKKADAVKFSLDTQAKLDALDKALSAKDATAISTAQRDVAVACGTCHKTYRATDDNNKFIIKPGTI